MLLTNVVNEINNIFRNHMVAIDYIGLPSYFWNTIDSPLSSNKYRIIDLIDNRAIITPIDDGPFVVFKFRKNLLYKED